MRTEPFTVEAVWPAKLDLAAVARKLVTAVISFHDRPIAAVAGLLPHGWGHRKLLLVVYTPMLLGAEELGALLDDSVLSAVHAVEERLDLGSVAPVLIKPVEFAGVGTQGAAAIESTFPTCTGVAWGGSAELLPVGFSREGACQQEAVTGEARA